MKPIRVVIENSGYHLLNMGDVAMLQAAVMRIENLRPGSVCTIITTDENRLARFCPHAIPLSRLGNKLHRDFLALPGKLAALPNPLRPVAIGAEAQLARTMPKTHAKLSRWLAQRRGEGLAPLADYLDALIEADLVIGTGGGYLTDSFAEHAMRILYTLDCGHQLGKPTALLGQGVGPIHDEMLMKAASRTLPHVQVITLREGRTGLPLLERMNLDMNRVMVTGDDALELVAPETLGRRGDRIGINVRICHYAGVDEKEITAIADSVAQLANEYATRVQTVPIALGGYDSDIASSEKLAIYPKLSSHLDQGQVDSPQDVIQLVTRCRVMVTGSYHAAVFSLAQGIPVVGLAKSAYYVGKFQGLNAQFPGGCSIVRLDQPAVGDRLLTSIRQAWHVDDAVRESLVEAGHQQRDRGRQAYAKLINSL